MDKEKQEWDKYLTPKLGTTDAMQRALDWWYELLIQNLKDINDSRVGYLWKYYPNKSHPYHLTGEEVQHIYESEYVNNLLVTTLTERQIIEALWKLLDNIDTLSDICKPTVENPKAAMAFYNNAMRYASERFKYMQSDGYKIFTNEEFVKLPKSKEEIGYKSIYDNPINET